MSQIMIRFNTDNPQLAKELVTAWLEDEGITIRTAGMQTSVDLTYVKERD